MTSIAERTPLLPITICLMIGILLGSALTISPLLLYLLLVVFLIAALRVGKHPHIQTIIIELCVLLIGMQSAQIHTNTQDRSTTSQHLLYDSAVVVSEPSEKSKTIAVDVIRIDSRQTMRCYIQKDANSRRLKPGDGITFMAKIMKGAHSTIQSGYVSKERWKWEKVNIKQLPRAMRFRIIFLKWRHRLLAHYRHLGAENDVYGVLAAMTLGDKSALTPSLRDTYSMTGASHVLALSGLHLGILYLLFTYLTQSFRYRHRMITQVLLIVSTWAFTFLVGLPVSIVRAAVMISIFSLLSIGYRSRMSVNQLCLTAIIILLWNPQNLWDVSFQLSFVAVLSILLLIPLFEREDPEPYQPKNRKKKIVGMIKSCIGVSVAAQIGVAPLIAFYFGRFSTYFLLTNLVIFPLVYLILFGTIIMLVISPFSIIVLKAVDILNGSLTFITKLPMVSIEGLHPSVAQILLYYVFVAMIYGAIITYSPTNARYRSGSLQS